MWERRGWLYGLYGVVVVIASAWLLASAVPAAAKALHGYPWDGLVDWLGAQAFNRFQNPYSPEGFRALGSPGVGFGHPPTTPFWFLPLAGLDQATMSLALGQIVIVMLFVHCLLIALELRLPAPLGTATLLFALTLSTSWMTYHLGLAQISEPIAFSYLLAWLLLRRGRDAAAGAMLGLACTLKLFPGLMVLFLLVAGRRRAVAGALAAWLPIAAYMTWGYGLSSWWHFFTQQAPIANNWVCHVDNASVQGIALRMFRPACQGYGPTLPSATALALGVSLMLVVLCWRLSARAVRRRGSSIDLPFALFSVLSYITNPWAWEHYNVFLILPIVLCANRLFAARRELGRIALTVGALDLALVLYCLSVDRTIKMVLHDKYPLDKSLHMALHYYEVINWLPAVLVMALLGALLHGSERRRGAFA